MGRYNDPLGKRLVGKTIESVWLNGYEIYLCFTDGSKFEYGASDGGYSTYAFFKNFKKGGIKWNYYQKQRGKD